MPKSNGAKEWFELLMEDIMRLYREKASPLKVKDIVDDCSVEKSEVVRAIKELEKRGLAKFENGSLSLTSRGEEMADVIYNYHRMFEDLLGHDVAHALEHIGKTAERVERFEGEVKALEEFRESERGIIAYFKIGNPKVVSRLLGVGLSPGVPFRVLKLRKDGIVLEVNDRLIVLDRELGKNIMGMSKVEGASRRTA